MKHTYNAVDLETGDFTSISFSQKAYDFLSDSLDDVKKGKVIRVL